MSTKKHQSDGNSIPNVKVRNEASRSFPHRLVMNPLLYCWWSIKYWYQLRRQKYKAATSADSSQIQLMPATPQDRLFLQNKTMNKLSDYCISENLELVNNSLAGKTIKRLFDSTKKRVMIEFSDGSNGMIEVLKQQSNGEEFLSVMPPVSQANV
jgi:hypothetical protein